MHFYACVRDCEIPLSTFVLDPQSAFVPALRSLLTFLLKDTAVWEQSCEINQYELCIRKTIEVISITCDMSSQPEDAATYAKVTLGEVCLPLFVPFAVGEASGAGKKKTKMIKSKREALDMIAQLIYKCSDNVRIVEKGLCGRNAFDFLAHCEDIKVQSYYLDMVYRVHRQSNQSIERLCSRFPKSQLKELFSFLRKNFKTFKEMEKASRKFLVSFNNCHNKHILSIQMKAIDVSDGSEITGLVAAERKSVAKQSWVDLGESSITFDIQDSGVLETIDIHYDKIMQMEVLKITNRVPQVQIFVGACAQLCRLVRSDDKCSIYLSPATKVNSEQLADYLSLKMSNCQASIPKISRGISYSKVVSEQGQNYQEVQKQLNQTPRGKSGVGREVQGGSHRIGSEVSVWWEDDNCFYHGRIDEYNYSNDKFHICYDDGEREWLDAADANLKFRGDKTAKAGVENTSDRPKSDRQQKKTPPKKAHILSPAQAPATEEDQFEETSMSLSVPPDNSPANDDDEWQPECERKQQPAKQLTHNQAEKPKSLNRSGRRKRTNVSPKEVKSSPNRDKLVKENRKSTPTPKKTPEMKITKASLLELEKKDKSKSSDCRRKNHHSSREGKTAPRDQAKGDKKRRKRLFRDEVSLDLSTSSQGTEAQFSALQQIVEQVLSSRKKKHARREKAILDSVKATLKKDCSAIQSTLQVNLEESLNVCSNANEAMKKELNAIRSKWEASTKRYQSEIKSHMKAYKKYKTSVGERQKEVKALIGRKIQTSKDLLDNLKSQAESVLETATVKIQELTERKNAMPQISKILNLLEE